jgi:iron complex transport system ATP-binding protein
VSRRAALRGRRVPAPVPTTGHGSPAVALTGAGYDVDGATLLDGVDLDVRAGELLCVVGPNGAGKSTLLGLLAGDLDATRGAVAYDGVPVAALPVTGLARRRAVLLQEHRLSFPFSVVDVVRMGRAPWQGTDAEDADDAAVGEALAAGDVRHLADRRFPTLSGGEKARTAYARARAQATPVLLLDEPTAALDIRHQEMVLAQARDLARAGSAVVAVLHDLSLAAAYADRVLLLGDGRTRAIGTPAEVLRPDLLGDVYRHPVEVLVHPRTGDLIVLPDRTASNPQEDPR